MKRGFIGGGVLFLSFAAIVLLAGSRRPWTPRADFDIIGVLWVLTNIPKLAVWFIALIFIGLALYAFAHAVGADSWGRSRLSPGSEEERMRRDPRFIADAHKPTE